MQNKPSMQMQVGIHQIPKSKWKFLLLSLQHVLAMFGANILVPILVNSAAKTEVIPLQVAFLCSGVGTILYLIITGFRTPIYLGSSFAYLGGMTTLYTTTGYNVFFSLMIVGVIYVFIAMFIYFTKKSSSIKKLLSPVIVGPAIMMIGWSLMGNAAKDAFLDPSNIFTPAHPGVDGSNIGAIWGLIAVAVITFAIIAVALIFFKGIWKMIPILLGIVGGMITAVIVWAIAIGAGNTLLADNLFGDANAGVKTLMNPSDWVWYPDITKMWMNTEVTDFKIEAYLAIVPIAVVTLAEHVGDHVNIGNITGNDFITNKPGIYRTLIGDGVATIVSAAMGGPANTSYGENTSVISMTKVASVWVIFMAAIFSIGISFLAPISVVLSAIPKPVLGGIEIMLYSMIAINGLRILIHSKTDMYKAKNLIIIAVLAVTGLTAATLTFVPAEIAGSAVQLSGTGVGVIIAVILNLVLPDHEEDTDIRHIESVDLLPIDLIEKIKLKRPRKKM